jgi:NitT/TauT family transport system substrate-binding protein
MPSPAAARLLQRFPRRLLAAATPVLVAAATVAGCGSSTAATGTTAAALTPVTVAVVPLADAVPVYIAQQDGYFKRVGLNVTIKVTAQSTAATADMVHGSVDVIASANYVNFFAGQAKGTLNIKVLAAGTACGTGTEAVLALPGLGIATPAGLAGKSIAVNIDPNIQTLTINRQLQADGVSAASVHYVVIPFARMTEALKAHQVDAISEVEPFLSQAEVSADAQVVLQQCTGPTGGIPLDGYISAAAWAAAHPATARAFQHAIEQAQAVAATNRAVVEKLLPTYMPITKQIASIVNLNTYETSLDAVPLQRVADLMQKGGMLARPFNVSPLLFR